MKPDQTGVLSLIQDRRIARGRVCFRPRPLHLSAFVDGVVWRMWRWLQGLTGSFICRVRERLVFLFISYDGLPVLVLFGLLAARQLEEGGQAVQVGHFVEGAQQQVHHHQTSEQVD